MLQSLLVTRDILILHKMFFHVPYYPYPLPSNPTPLLEKFYVLYLPMITFDISEHTSKYIDILIKDQRKKSNFIYIEC